MSDLIDRDTLKESMISACNIFESKGVDTTIARVVISIIDVVAGTDAMPVVRCKDCIWREQDNCPMEFYWDVHPADDNVYCSFGKRRADMREG